MSTQSTPMNALQLIIQAQSALWECDGCGLFCPQHLAKCRACETPKPGTPAAAKSKKITFASVSGGFANSSPFALSATPSFGSTPSPAKPLSISGGGFNVGGMTTGGVTFGTPSSKQNSASPFAFKSGAQSPFSTKKNESPNGSKATRSAMDIDDLSAPFRYQPPRQIPMAATDEKDLAEETFPFFDIDEDTDDYANTSADEELKETIQKESPGKTEDQLKRAVKQRKNAFRRTWLKKMLTDELARVPVGSHVVVATGDGSINGVLGRGRRRKNLSSNFPVPISTLFGNQFQQISTGAMSCAALTFDSNELYVWGSNEHGELTENPLDIPDIGEEADLPEDEAWPLRRKEYHRRITEIYKVYSPPHLNKLDNWLDGSPSEVHDLYVKICKKYKLKPEEELIPPLPPHRLAKVLERTLNPSKHLKNVTNEREFARRASCIYYSPVRMRIPRDIRVCQIDFGAAHVAILDEDGLVYSMGTFNSDGVVGHHWDEKTNKIVLYQRSFYAVNELGERSSRMKPIREIACGANHFLMLDEGGDIWQMGVTQLGQRTSRRNARMYLQPHSVLRVMRKGCRVKYLRIRAGDYHNMAISRNYELFTWGQNNYLQCGHPQPKNQIIKDVIDNPQCVEFKENIKVMDVRGGEHFTIVLDEKGRVWSFGRNASFCLGRKTDRPPRMRHQTPSGEIKMIKQERKPDLPEIVPNLDEIDLIGAGGAFWLARSKYDHQKVVAFGFSTMGCCGAGNWKAARGTRVFDSTILPDDFVVDGMCGSANHSLFLLRRRDSCVPRINLETSQTSMLMKLDVSDSDESEVSSQSKKRSRTVMERESQSPPDITSLPRKSQRTETKRTATSRKTKRPDRGRLFGQTR